MFPLSDKMKHIWIYLPSQIQVNKNPSLEFKGRVPSELLWLLLFVMCGDRKWKEAARLLSFYQTSSVRRTREDARFDAWQQLFLSVISLASLASRLTLFYAYEAERSWILDVWCRDEDTCKPDTGVYVDGDAATRHTLLNAQPATFCPSY